MIGAAGIILGVVCGSIWCFVHFQPKGGDVTRLKSFNTQVLWVVALLYLSLVGALYLSIDASEELVGIALISALLFVPVCLALAAIYRSKALAHPHGSGQSTV